MRWAAIAALILLSGFSGRGSNPDAQPQAAIPGIVFVGAPIFDEKTDGGVGVYQGSYHWRDSYIYARSATYHRGERTMGPVRPGKNLYSLVPARPDGKLTRLTHLKSGAVFKPEPFFDGTKVLFAMRRDGEDWFHLYEINVDGSNLKQLTDGPFNDFAGVYLPDGRIVFCSDRTGYLEEYHEERTETLFTMNGDGTNIQQITFLPGTYFEPTVLRDGRIMFSFWDGFHIDVPPFDKHETYLMTVHPDGTEERHLFGSGQYRFFNRERHSGVGLTQAREMPDGRILLQSEMGPAILDLSAGLSVRDALTPIFPGTTSIQVGGTTHRSHLSPLGTRSTPQPLQDGRFLFSATAPGARDSAIYVADPDTRAEELVVNIPNFAEFDAVPVLVEKPRPSTLPANAKPQAGTAKFLVIAGRETDNVERGEAMKRARFFRVVEAEYTGVTTSSHTNLETRILGVVPIHPDGSAYFEAPADTPIFLDPLDAAGNRVLMKWNYENTAVAPGTHYPATQMGYMSARAGETRSCFGCHAPQSNAVPNVSVMALKHEPVKITHESTDIQYRRNEPEAYRRQARIGDGKKYIAWLNDADPVKRARACEMLMYLEDEAAPALKTIASLQQDQAAEVRNAATLTLTRLAAPSGYEGEQLHKELAKPLPNVLAIRAAGKFKDADAVKYLIPWLAQHEQEYHAAEAAIALGRIGTKEAVEALWTAARREIPNKKVHISRYLQHGPRPEEYAILRALIIADAPISLQDLYLLIAMFPNTFTEKPRFEDRMRSESQRALMPRLMMERAGMRRRAVDILLAALQKTQKTDDPVYEQLIKGINLERPFSEHGRPFPVVKQIGTEETLWLLSCLVDANEDLDSNAKRQAVEELLIPFLTSTNQRERVDSAVLLGIIGFGPKAEAALIKEILKPYPFPEIASMGKGMPDANERDKAYMAMALAKKISDVGKLKPLADPKTMFRDIRYGLARGLAMRGKADGIALLVHMATTDPITLVRQQARYGVADIQDGLRLAGEKVPQVVFPPPLPLEAHYPPRGLKWADTTFDDLPKVARQRSLEQLLVPASFRNLNMAQATGARYMMTSAVEETRDAFDRLPRDASALPALLAALDSPYPHAHYLAAKTLADRNERSTIPHLIRKLDAYLKVQDMVGFWWCCEALGRLKATEAIPVLRKYATATNPPLTYGPEGMPAGYVAARAVARIAADGHDPFVAQLLQSDNIWLKSGALRGLAEAKAPGIETILRRAAAEDNPALIRAQARIHLRPSETIKTP